MANDSGHARICPTRIDGAHALFAHRVTVPKCQDRQRGRYHKCYTCAHNNAYVAAHGTVEEREAKHALAAKTAAQKPARAAKPVLELAPAKVS
jgi:hypothetical protein